MPFDAEALWGLLPEFCLGAAAVIAMVGGVFSRNVTVWYGVCTAGAVVGLISLVVGETPPAGPSALAWDGLTHVTRVSALILVMLFLLAAWRGLLTTARGESMGLLTLVFVGLMLVGVANNLLLHFLCLELISIPTYVLLFLGRRDTKSAEATTKYFFLSLLSSGMFLYGLALLYGVAGSLDNQVIAARLGAGGEASLSAIFLPISVVFIFAGLGFKIAAVPFHFYAPDVYEATTSLNAGLLAVVPKMAGVLILVRVTSALAMAQTELIWQIALVLAVLTMTLGNVCALRQDNPRRLMAYSSIAHAGYILIGIAVGCAESSVGARLGTSGFSAAYFYVVLYAVASLGLFATLVHLEQSGEPVERLEQLAGMSQRRPWLSAVMAVCLFSLMGIPPLAGFWGKLILFTGALQTAQAAGLETNSGRWFLVLAVAGALNAAVAAAYYLRIAGIVYFGNERDKAAKAKRGPAGGAALICAVFVVVLGVFPGRLLQRCQDLSPPLNARDSIASVTVSPR